MSTPLSTNTLKWSIGDTFSNKHWYQFDVTEAVQGWVDGNYNQNKGFLFKVADSVENGDEILSRTFGSYNRTNYRPSLTVNYTEPSAQFLANDTYYINNKETGKYLQINNSGVINGVSGLLNSLGNRVQWQIRKVQGGYVIQSVMDPTKYLSGSASLSDSSVNVISISDAAIPNTCLWAITAANGTGCLIRNMSNNRYLRSDGTSVYTSYNIGTYESTTYKNFVWRMASISYYGNSSAHSARELESGYAIEDVVVKVGESKTPYVTQRPHNAIWADASDFVLSISAGEENGISIIQPQNSVLGQIAGSVLCTATHKVTGTTDTFVVYTQPLLIFQTNETYNGDENVDIAEDLLYGDLDENDLRELDWINRTHFLGQTSEWYEAEWRAAVASVYAHGELLGVANDMIDHFMAGTGSSYSNSTLTNKVVAHSETTRYTDSIQTYLEEVLNLEDGDIYALLYTWENRSNSVLYNRIYDNHVAKPVYGSTLDTVEGLRICINSIWGAKAEVTEYTRTGNTYTCTLHYTFYDHFGLDEGDVEEFGYAPGFVSWFVLQRYSEYGGAYKPFLTLMEFDKTFTGTIS